MIKSSMQSIKVGTPILRSGYASLAVGEIERLFGIHSAVVIEIMSCAFESAAGELGCGKKGM